jgi:hypothetical protein
LPAISAHLPKRRRKAQDDGIVRERGQRVDAHLGSVQHLQGGSDFLPESTAAQRLRQPIQSLEVR